MKKAAWSGHHAARCCPYFARLCRRRHKMVYGNIKLGRGSKPGTTSDTADNDADVHGNDSAQHGEDWQDELLPKLTIKDLFRGWEGTLVMGFGVLIPSLLIAIVQLTCLERMTLVFFDHPL